MKEIFAKHYETLQVKDGNFYNDKAISPALQFFKEKLLNGDGIEIIEPLLGKLVKNTHNLVPEATELAVLFYLKSYRYADIFRLPAKIFPKIFNNAICNVAHKLNIDIYPLLIYVIEHKILEVYPINEIFKHHFDEKIFPDTQLNQRRKIAEKIVDKEIIAPKIADLIYHLLSKYFPKDCFLLLKKLLYQKAHAYDSMNYFLDYLPDYQEYLKEDIGYIESLLLKNNTGNYWNYANHQLKNLLLIYYFYEDDFEAVKKLFQITEGYDAYRSIYNVLVQLLVNDPGKTDKYFPLILDAFKKDSNYLNKSLKKCFETLRQEKFELNEHFIKILIRNLDTQNNIRVTLEALLAYHTDISHLKKIESKNPYFQGLTEYYKTPESEYCNYCATTPMILYSGIDLSQMNICLTFNKENAIVEDYIDRYWRACKTCGQDYFYLFEEEQDFIPRTYETLIKTNPIELLQKIKDPESTEKIKASYSEKLAKAKKSVYSPFPNLRLPAAKFLTQHYISESNQKGLDEFLKTLASDCLIVAFECIYNHLYNGRYPFSEVDFLFHFSNVEYSQYDLGRVVMVDLMIKNDQSGMLKCLESDNSEFLRGVFSLMTIGYGPFKNFKFSPEIFQKVYRKGIESRAVISGFSEFICKNKYTSDSVNVQVMLQTLEKTEDLNSISYLLSILSGLKNELPALHESIVQKLLKLSDIEEMETKAADFLTEMFKLNKVQREGLLLIADYFIDNKPFICNEYQVNVLDIKNRKDDFVYTYFTCIQTQNEPYFWLSKFNAILKVSKDHIVQTCLMKSINHFAEKGIDIELLQDELIHRFKNPDNLLKAEIQQILENYQKHYNHFNLNAL